LAASEKQIKNFSLSFFFSFFVGLTKIERDLIQVDDNSCTNLLQKMMRFRKKRKEEKKRKRKRRKSDAMKQNEVLAADFGAELISTRAEFESRKHSFLEQTEAESHFLAADSAKD